MIFIFMINLYMKGLYPIEKFEKMISKDFEILEPREGPPRGTPYLGFQIEIKKTPRLSLE